MLFLEKIISKLVPFPMGGFVEDSSELPAVPLEAEFREAVECLHSEDRLVGQYAILRQKRDTERQKAILTERQKAILEEEVADLKKAAKDAMLADLMNGFLKIGAGICFAKAISAAIVHARNFG